MKIAVIGGGISGISASLILSKKHEVTLFEKEARLGGHAHSETVRFGSKKISVDTAFVVFNPERYPNLNAFFSYLKVATLETDMSLAVSLNKGAFEYNNMVPVGLFADPVNLLRPSFIALLVEITHFNAVATKALKKGIPSFLSLDGFLRKNQFSEDLQRKYLYPMVGAIWSTPRKRAKKFSAGVLLGFLDNHHLLSTGKHFKWRTVKGGSIHYVKKAIRLMRKNGAVIHAGARVSKVERFPDHVVVHNRGKREHFDYVVFATHADETLTLIKKPLSEEKKLLKPFTYEKNEVVLHSDARYMPVRKNAWAAWNYVGNDATVQKEEKVALTYWMNRLQGINNRYPLFVTLNPYTKIKKNLIHKSFRYSHPLYSSEANISQKSLHKLQGKNRSLFCGSYFGYGFHEDGITSAIAVARYLGVKPPWKK